MLLKASQFKSFAFFILVMPFFLFAQDSASLMEFRKAIKEDNYNLEIARFAEKYLGPSVSSKKRLKIINEILFEADIKDPAVGRAVASVVMEHINTASDLNSAFFKLRDLTKGSPELLYEKGLEILRSEKDKRLATSLVHLGEQIKGPSKNHVEDFKFLVSRGATDSRYQDLLLKKAPKEAPEILLAQFGSHGTFNGSYYEPKAADDDLSFATSEVDLDDLDYVKKLVFEGKISLNSEHLKQLEAKLLNPDVSPQAKAIAFDILKERDGASARRVLNKLLDSSQPVDHLMAERLLRTGVGVEERGRLQKALQDDLLHVEDSKMLSLLARNPFNEEASWKDIITSEKDVMGLKQLIQHPDEKLASLAIKILSEQGQSFGLIPDLLREHLIASPKASSMSTHLTLGINEPLSDQLLQALKKFPNEVRDNSSVLIDAITSSQNKLPRKKFAFSLLESAGSTEAALPTFLSEISKRRNYQSEEELDWMADEAASMVRKNPEIFKRYEEALNSKFQRLSAEPPLIGNLKGKDPFEEKLAIARVLLRMGAKSAMDFFWEELKKPLDLEVPEAGRLKYARVAKAFSEAIKEDPSLMTPEIRKQLREFLASKDPAFTTAQNDLNKFLPTELTQAIDKEVTQDRLHPSNTDPCAVMCRVAKSLAEKIGDNFEVQSDKYLASEDAKSSFSFAIRSLMGEFLLKANQSGCQIEEIKDKVSKLMTEANTMAKGEMKDSTSQNKEVAQKAIKGSGASSDAIERALAFLEKTSSSQNINEQGLPTNSATLYFYLQTQRAIEALKQSGAESNQKATAELQKRIEEHLSKITNARSDLAHGEGGSLVTVYAIAAIGASMPEGSDIQKRIARIFSEMRSESKEKGQTAFPYNFDPKVPRESERGGAARSVVAQLAIYKGGGSDERLANADHLLASLGVYDKHFRDVFSGIGLNRTHDESDVDKLAPYYGPSTIPYVFEALSTLSKEKELSVEQIGKLESIKTSLQKKLLGMFQPDGLFQPQNSNFYSSATLYDNALTGLALEQACRDQKPSTKPGVEGESRHSQKPISTH